MYASIHIVINIISVFQEEDSVHGFQAISDTINDWWLPHKLDVGNHIKRNSMEYLNGDDNDNDGEEGDEIEDEKIDKSKMNNNIDNVFTTSTEDIVSSEVMIKSALVGVCGTYTAAVQDDYEYWRMCGESDKSGKLFLIDYNGDNDTNDSNDNNYNDSNDNDNDNEINDYIDKKEGSFDIKNNIDENNITNNENKNNRICNENKKSELSSNNNNNPKKTIQLFFDDNIERDRLHIVDVRDLRTLIPVPFTKVNNIFVKKVEPYFAIIDDNYFINEALNMINAQLKLQCNMQDSKRCIVFYIVDYLFYTKY